jgi:hypothetical protein
MQVRIMLQIVGDDGTIGSTEQVADLTKVTERAEDLGLSLAESKALLAAAQQRIVEAQVNGWLEKHRHCAISGRKLRFKGSYPITFRTLFGEVQLKSPRFYVPKERQANGPATISPLTQLLPDHVAPERLYLETRWASLVPYAAAADLLADVLPIGSGVNATTVRQHVLRTAERMESDLAEQRASFTEGTDPRDWEDLPTPEGRMVIGLDGGYIRDWRDRKKNFERHRQLNAFTCSFWCLGPERATHFQELRPTGEELKAPEHGLYSVKLTVPPEGSDPPSICERGGAG